LNFVGKVENIDEDWKTLCSIIDIPYVPMVHIKSQFRGQYASLYDKETVEIVADMYQRDFELFDYSKKLTH